MKQIDYARKEYIKIIRSMSGQDRLKKCFELSEVTKELFLTGLQKRFSKCMKKEIIEIYLKRIDKCHNVSY